MGKRDDLSQLSRRFKQFHRIYLIDPNGRGGTATKVRRFLTVSASVGNSMTLTQDATNGDSIAINKTGLYAISYSDSLTTGSAGEGFGISLNAGGSGTTDYSALTDAQRMASGGVNTAGVADGVSWVGLLSAGDSLRAHLSGTAGDTTTYLTRFSMIRLF